MYQPKPQKLFKRRGYVFRCLFIDECSILFEDVHGARYLDTSGDDFEPATSWDD